MSTNFEEKFNYVRSLIKAKTVKFLSTQERRQLSPNDYEIVYDTDFKNYVIWDGNKWVFWGKPSVSGARLKKISKFIGAERYRAVSFAINNYGYVGTGESEEACKDFYRYDPSINVWTQIADHPIRRYWAVAFVIGEYAYVGTGWVDEEDRWGPSQDFWRYDPLNNIWTQITDFPIQIYLAVAFTINNYAYVGTGADLNHYTRKWFYRYDPSNNTWTQVSDLGGEARRGAAAFSIKQYSYVGMGETPSKLLRDFWKYDPSNNTWTQIYMFPASARFRPVGFNIGNYGYIAGGLRDIWFYDPYNNIWHALLKLEYDIEDATVFVINNSAYIGTGEIFEYLSYILNDFWQLTNIYP